MTQDDHIIFGEVYVCLYRIGANFHSSFEGAHGVLRIIGFVPAMGDSLREHVSTSSLLCKSPLRCRRRSATVVKWIERLVLRKDLSVAGARGDASPSEQSIPFSVWSRDLYVSLPASISYWWVLKGIRRKFAKNGALRQQEGGASYCTAISTAKR